MTEQWKVGKLKNTEQGPKIDGRAVSVSEETKKRIGNDSLGVLYRENGNSVVLAGIVVNVEVAELTTRTLKAICTVEPLDGNPKTRRGVEILFRMPVKKGAAIEINNFRIGVPSVNPGTDFLLSKLAEEINGVDLNPYNFVSLAQGGPWLENAGNSSSVKAHDHSRWHPGLKHGYVEFELLPLTPIFVPEGFPIRGDQAAQTARYFCRLHRRVSDGLEVCYAIPGASLKGPIRAMVEALTQDRFGASSAHDGEIAYTRRVRGVQHKIPARHTIRSLAAGFFIDPESDARGFSTPLGLAEQMFGFAAAHKDGHHPVRGKLRFATAWGPAVPADEGRRANEDAWPAPKVWEGQAPSPPGMKVQLAALSAPKTTTHGMCGPLYLEPLNNGESASYCDGPPPRLRGRKFYWKQRPPDGQALWHEHTRERWAKQQPPPLYALAPLEGNKFRCRIEFENLTPIELGALLFALTGNGNPAHAIQIGKGKPRGLGVCQVQRLSVVTEKPGERYESLSGDRNGAATDPTSDAHAAFRAWCCGWTGVDATDENFQKLEHISDFIRLHTWPDSPSFRHYPLSFDDFRTWADGDNLPRAPAMGAARDLEP